MAANTSAPMRPAKVSPTNPRPRDVSPGASRIKLWFSLVFVVVAVVFATAAFAYTRIAGQWRAESEYEQKLPRPAMDVIVQSLKTFHLRNGRFPANFNELDVGIWNRERYSLISPDGRTLTARNANYLYAYYRPHEAKAVLWAVPLGERRTEAATHLWFVTLKTEERWAGPALLPQNFGAANAVPSEQQLRFLQMVLQRPELQPDAKRRPRGIFSVFD